jgi:hypothetical protein
MTSQYAKQDVTATSRSLSLLFVFFFFSVLSLSVWSAHEKGRGDSHASPSPSRLHSRDAHMPPSDTPILLLLSFSFPFFLTAPSHHIYLFFF